MRYIWQNKRWPHFEYDLQGIQDLLYRYAIATNFLTSRLHCLSDDLQIDSTIDLMVEEAIKTSKIEGEKIDQEEVRLSIKNQWGLMKDHVRIKDPRAEGIAQLMICVRQNFDQPLSKQELFSWHSMILPQSYNKTVQIGQWRTGKEAMQIISGVYGREKVHYQPPPSSMVNKEMERFITWFNETDPRSNKQPLPGPVRAAIAHLYFECIHPFDDGNGRIGRALSEKALSQEIQRPVLFSLSSMIEKHKKDYYHQLSLASRDTLEITGWIEYFVRTVYDAVLDSNTEITALLKKAQFWKLYSNKLNQRQSVVLARMFKEGAAGFQGGINASKYMKIAHCSKATATRDLSELVKLDCIEPLTKGGRGTAYQIKFPPK